MDDRNQNDDANQAGGEKKQTAANELRNYLKAEKEEEAWLERMQAAAKARKAKEEAGGGDGGKGED